MSEKEKELLAKAIDTVKALGEFKRKATDGAAKK